MQMIFATCQGSDTISCLMQANLPGRNVRQGEKYNTKVEAREGQRCQNFPLVFKKESGGNTNSIQIKSSISKER